MVQRMPDVVELEQYLAPKNLLNPRVTMLSFHVFYVSVVIGFVARFK